MNKDISSFSLACMLLGFAPLGYSLPFTIVPLGTLPTTVSAGASVSAKYTVTNNTGTTRINNYVKYLPPNVTQVTTGTGVCGPTFTLAPLGQAGDSCTLSLIVSGAVNASDPDPRQHLFVCFPGGVACAGTNSPLNVSLISTLVPQIVGGSYTDGSVYFPMLASSINGGSWTYPIDSTSSSLPTDYSDGGVFYQANCTASICVTAGFYSDTTDTYPMLAQSINNAATWTYPIEKGSTLPAQYANSGKFQTSMCSGSTCIAGGSYNSLTKAYPMVAANTGAGSSWVFTLDANTLLPLDYNDNGYITGVSCSGNVCVAGGSYDDPAKNYLLLAVSTNAGATWAYAIDKTPASLPPSFNGNGSFLGVGCDGAVCVAAGTYFLGAPTNKDYPLLSVSTDSGSTWNYKIDNAPSTLPSNFNAKGRFNSASCNGSTCIASGRYATNTADYPMLSVSLDGGINWVYKIDSSTSLPLDYSDKGNLLSTSCSAQVCITGGSYNDANQSYPLLAVSTDAGLTWTYKIDKTPATLPSDYSAGGSFLTVSCTLNVCTAGGTYRALDTIIYPLLAESKDGGITWTYQVDSTPASLPATYSDQGVFGGTNQ